MALLLVVCVILCPAWALADVGCDGIDDGFTTAIAASNFITTNTGSLVLVYMPTGTPDSVQGQGECFGGEALISDGSNGPYIGLFRHSDFAGGDNLCAFNWSGDAGQAVPAAYSVNVRTHLAWVHSGGNLLFYKDGALVSSVASGGTDTLARTLRVCGGIAAINDGSVPGEGRMIEAKTYNVALTAAEIASEGTSAVHNVIPVAATARWDFDGGNPPCTVGASGNGVVFADGSGNARPITGDFGANATGASCLGSSIPYQWGVW